MSTHGSTFCDLPASLEPFQALRSLVAAKRAYPFLLDSGCDPTNLGRRSFAGSDPFLVVHAKDTTARLSWLREGREEAWYGNPFELVRELLQRYRDPRATPFPLACGGAVGYLAYDLFPHLEVLQRHTRDDLAMPDLFLGFYDTVAVFDHAEGRNAVCTPGGPTHLADLWHHLPEPPPLDAASVPPLPPGALQSNFTPQEYRAAVTRVKEWIAAGDCYQVNLSQRFSVAFQEDPLAFYARLRAASAAPFGACLFPDRFAVLSNSPERYLKIDGGRIETRPIKGTRRRGATREEDLRLARELLESEKERAEHVMIVDLERNDLGRVCTYDSVHVPEFEVVESYANVHHLVSTVAGRVHPSRDEVDCICNSFPGGSITGAPKVRALENIEALEPTARGVYCGSIGYIDFSGRVDLNIAIRTAIVSNGRLHFQVGGGIVADSDPQEEYQETITKAQSFLKALTGQGRLWEE